MKRLMIPLVACAFAFAACDTQESETETIDTTTEMETMNETPVVDPAVETTPAAETTTGML